LPENEETELLSAYRDKLGDAIEPEEGGLAGVAAILQRTSAPPSEIQPLAQSQRPAGLILAVERFWWQSGKTADPKTVAEYTLGALKRVVPPAVPGIFFLSGGQSEIQATENLNAMNKTPNPWHVSFSYARALQNTTLKTWAGKDENKIAAQSKLFQRASANSKAQKGEYDPATANEDASAAEGMYVKGYTY